MERRNSVLVGLDTIWLFFSFWKEKKECFDGHTGKQICPVEWPLQISEVWGLLGEQAPKMCQLEKPIWGLWGVGWLTTKETVSGLWDVDARQEVFRKSTERQRVRQGMTSDAGSIRRARIRWKGDLDTRVVWRHNKFTFFHPFFYYICPEHLHCSFRVIWF